jgi:integrase
MSDKAFEVGAMRGDLVEKDDVGHWTPDDLLAIGREAWRTPVPKSRRGDEERYRTRTFLRLRSGLFFLLAYETPLRLRNFREMRWGTNLKKNAEGRYALHFKGLELKVANRGFRTNEYRHTYSEEASACIDRWRAHLVTYFGDEFEARCPYVFAASTGRDRPADENSFRLRISALVFELRGETFNPHKVRHIVASYLVRETKGGHNLAAKLLGNRKETVLSTYDRPNNEEALQEYLEKRRLGKL